MCDCCDGSDEPKGHCKIDCGAAVSAKKAQSKARRNALKIKDQLLAGEKHKTGRKGFPLDLQSDIEIGLKGVCFSWNDSEFTYDLCPFGSPQKAKQAEKRRGKKEVSLGWVCIGAVIVAVAHV